MMVLHSCVFIKIFCILSLLCVSGCAFNQKKKTTSTPITVAAPRAAANNAWQTTGILASAQESPYSALIFSPDNQFLITCNQKGSIEVWNVLKNRLHTTWTVKDPIHAFTFRPDGTQLAATTERAANVRNDNDTTLYIWQWPTGTLLHTMHNPTGTDFLRYTHDGKELITASCESGLINYWNPHTAVLQHSLHLALKRVPLDSAYDEENDYYVQNITISPDDKYIACTYNHTYYPMGPDIDPEISHNYLNEICVAIWNNVDGKLIKKINTGLIDYARCACKNEIVFSPDGMCLATGHLAGALCTISVADWSVTKLEYYTEGKPLSGRQILAFSPDSTYLAATNLENRKFPDEQPDTTIWNVKTGQLQKRFEQSNQITFAFDSKHFALCKKQPIDSTLSIEIVSHA